MNYIKSFLLAGMAILCAMIAKWSVFDFAVVVLLISSFDYWMYEDYPQEELNLKK